eukprot:11213696-Lingulodinium_polyedra.AAC.1
MLGNCLGNTWEQPRKCLGNALETMGTRFATPCKPPETSACPGDGLGAFAKPWTDPGGVGMPWGCPGNARATPETT